jgi:thiamine pyrophosphate-dependent acetolactate synthase large subunit-like protein
MSTEELLKAFAPHRGNAIVVPGRGGRYWVRISDQPDRDVPLGDPAMGGHAMFAFGVALAQPKTKVVVFDSDGDLQMSLGVLATIADLAPENFYHFVLDNECYATTGGQPVPNAKNIAYDVIAKGAGYARTYAFTRIEDFAAAIGDIMAGPGPVFCTLKVKPEIINEAIGSRPKWQTRTRKQAVLDLRKALGAGG